MMRAALLAGVLAALAAGAPAAASAPDTAGAAARGPLVRQLVVPPSGRAFGQTVRADAATVRAGRSRCGVGRGTPLAALARARLPRLRILDFGNCSRRARDAAGLYVKAIGRFRGRGSDGWVYKVGNRQATAGAADPAGPFGRGRLRSGARVLWFYCRFDAAAKGCQRTLAVRSRPEAGGAAVRVLAYDDRGRALPAAGATVRSGSVEALTDSGGFARLALPAGRHRLRAEQAGRVRSFDEVVTVGS